MSFKSSILVACLTVFAASGPAQAEEASAVRPEAIRAHLEFLADDLLEGRAAGSRGYDLAAAYVVARFREYGLEPGGEDSGYLQTFPLVEGSAVLPGSSVTLMRGDSSTTFDFGTHYLPSASFSRAKAAVEAPMVFVGFGVSAPELGYDDLAGVDLEGKVAVLFYGAPASFPHNERAYYSWSTLKLQGLVERGAIGTVTLFLREDLARYPWEKQVSLAWLPGMRWVQRDGSPADDFPQIQAGIRFGPALAALLFEGSGHSLADVESNARAGQALSFPLDGRLAIHTTTLLRQTRSTNVIGLLEGGDPVLRNEYVVVTAHLDGLGKGAAIGGDTIYNGAYDNAAGGATLLEIARQLALGPRPRRSLLFAAVGAEEKGLLGSDFFARNPTVPPASIVANLNMDMPLALVPMADFVAFGAEHSSLGPVIERAAAAEGYRLTPDPWPEEVIFIRSDQFSFVRQGIPSIYLDSGSSARDPGVAAMPLMQEFLQKNYHQPSDDVSLPIDYGTLAGLARVNIRILREVADTTQRPDWNAGDFFGIRFANGRVTTATRGSPR